MQTPEQIEVCEAANGAMFESRERRAARNLAVRRGEQIPDLEQRLAEVAEDMRTERQFDDVWRPRSGYGPGP